MSVIVHFGDVIVSVLTLRAVDHEIEPRSVETKDYTIGICCFSAWNIKEKERLVCSVSG